MAELSLTASSNDWRYATLRSQNRRDRCLQAIGKPIDTATSIDQ